MAYHAAYQDEKGKKIPWYHVSQRNFDRICVWSAVGVGVFFFLFFPIGDFLPPISPSASSYEVVQHYKDHLNGIRAGSALMQFTGPFYCMFVAAISSQMSRIPGCSHAMIVTQAVSGGISAYTLTIPSLFFTITSYRMDRPPELMVLMNDISWMFTVVPFTTFISQNFAFSYAILMDKREKPLFPHWFAWFSTIWPFGFWGALGLHTTYTGAFAWNGAICFWTAAGCFGVGMVLTVYYLLRAINREDNDLLDELPPQ